MDLDIDMDLNMNIDNEIVSNLDVDQEQVQELHSYTRSQTYTNTYNGLNDYGNYNVYGYSNSNSNTNSNTNNLYNPMIHRGFQNSDDAIYTLHNYLLSLSLNSSNTTINSGLTKKELEKNSNRIECWDITDCPICLCNYPKYTYFYLMHCKHSFCIECCEKWFSKNSLCPLCRHNYK